MMHTEPSKDLPEDYLSEEYFLSLHLNLNGLEFALVSDKGKYKTVEEMIGYIKDNYKLLRGKATKRNHSFLNFTKHQFRKDVMPRIKVRNRSVAFYSLSYLSSLEAMTDNEIRVFLSDNPIKIRPRSYSCCKKKPINNYFLMSGYHRVFAMIGRIIDGKSYIQFKRVVV